MRFDLTDLRLFLHVHEAGTITAGAERAHLALASASERLLAMEQALGAPLLVRGRRGVRATPAGQTLAHHARIVLQKVEQLRGELGAHGSGLAGHVRLLCNTSAMSEHLPAPLAAFLAAHPRTAVDAQERSSDNVADGVRDGLCDIGIASRTADLQGLAVVPFVADPLDLVVPRGIREGPGESGTNCRAASPDTGRR
ncbi:LysR family transcriptional regulator, partial [Paracidovorax avenae]|uniref:LysR family transcriptional regulator n=1 Tax=Paracidovorax avenae TaxID=80867 RepID=UPI001F442E40